MTTANKAKAPIIAHEDDLSYELALAAWRSGSHEREETARSEQSGYVASVQAVYERMLAICTNDQQRDLLADEMERFRQNYLKHYTAMLSAAGRFNSVFIDWYELPERNQKRLNKKVYRRRLNKLYRRRQEYLNWRYKAEASIREKLLDARTPEEKEEAAWEALRAEIIRRLHVITAVDTNNAPYRRNDFVHSIAGIVECLAKIGKVSLVDRAVALVSDYNASHKKPAISKRHKFWTYPDVARAVDAAWQAATIDGAVIAEGDGWRIETAPEDDRVRIYFDSKPDETIRSELKGTGWKWAPSAGAWQHKLTNKAIASAKVLMDC
jgi:hypothetical protein